MASYFGKVALLGLGSLRNLCDMPLQNNFSSVSDYFCIHASLLSAGVEWNY